MLVITKATTNEFERAVERARKFGPRAALIHRSLDISVSYTSDMASAFWDYALSVRAKHSASLLELVHSFHETRGKVRLAHELSACNIKKAADAGYIVLDGALRGLWSNIPGKGLWLLDNAISDGALRLNCYDIPHLVQLYQSRGFEIVRSELNKFDHTQPGVVWMERHAT